MPSQVSKGVMRVVSLLLLHHRGPLDQGGMLVCCQRRNARGVTADCCMLPARRRPRD
jgi:hypothetical protein